MVDALALSQMFSTKVLCVYSNDEDCDFAATADNGKLVRLRLKAGQKKGKQVDDAIARNIDSEIKAVRVLMEGETPDDDESVFDYTAFEVIETETQPLALHPYWTFREGEIAGQVVFETLKSSPEGTAPNLIFRNAFLEFEEAFGKTPPDFTDMPETGRFTRIDFKALPQMSILTKTVNFFGSLRALLFGSRKATLWTSGIIFVLAAGLFGNKDAPKEKAKRFVQHCTAAGGSLVENVKDRCQVENKIYQNWNLPGETGESRIMIVTVAPQQIACADNSDQKCLSVGGESFPNAIEGFTFQEGKPQIVPVERLQLCDPKTDSDCRSPNDMFTFRQLLVLGK